MLEGVVKAHGSPTWHRAAAEHRKEEPLSTTIVTELSNDPYAVFAVVTVHEDDAEERMRESLKQVSKFAINDGLGSIDDVELRASLYSELRVNGLQLSGLMIYGFGAIGE